MPAFVSSPLAVVRRTLLLLSVSSLTLAGQSGKITVGRNVLISGERPNMEHGEAVICASTKNPNHLVAAAASTTGGKQFQGHNEITGEIVYVSRDGGKSWKYAFDTFKQGFSPDAACTYTPDGAAHFSTMAGPANAGDDYFDNPIKLLNYRSPDGGLTWDPPVTLPGVKGADRQYMIADHTGGKYHGHLYIGYDWAFNVRSVENKLEVGATQLYGLSRSPDGGKRWDFPALRLTNQSFHNGNLAVLSDGTILSIVGFGGAAASQSYQRSEVTGQSYVGSTVHMISSPPGGEFVGFSTKVADKHDVVKAPPGVHYIHAIAVDSSKAYKDRIYVVWNDARSGRYQPLVSYSADRGKSWSTPRSASDDVLFDADAPWHGPHGTSPWVEVNKDGVVGVVWLDRRESRNSTAYHMRFSASLDGGETWLPSVRVSEQPMAARMVWEMGPYHFIYRSNPDTISAKLGAPSWDFTGGDVTALTADANGNFFPIWVDARSGIRQMYTAKLTVSGKVAPQRILVSTPTAVTRSVALEFVPGTHKYDSASRTLYVDAQLRNIGKDTLRAPLIAQVTKLSTEVGERITVANSDNGRTTIGAEWNFGPALTNGVLLPGSTTRAKRLVFHLEGKQDLSAQAIAGGLYGRGYMTVSVVVLTTPR